MPIDTWFPLAVYYNDLPDAVTENAKLREAVLQLEKESRAHDTNNMAWTGDVSGVARLHDDARFDWLLHQVEQHCLAYMTALGYDLDKIGLYIQRSWPVISRKGQRIAVHAHHTAHISGVYYVSIPDVEDKEDAGAFILYNESSPNEFQAGIATESTGAIKDWNALSFQRGCYLPEAGRLLLFPAKQNHSVEPNKTDELRISISFDIVMTSSDKAKKDTLEFLAPPPHQWKAFRQNQ